MTLSRFLPLSLVLTAGLAGGWFIRGSSPAAPPSAAAARRPLYYQSPMHPWVKSDRPGKCTICGMDLVPLFDDSTSAAGAANKKGWPSSRFWEVFDDSTSAAGAAPNVVLLPAGAPAVIGVQAESVARTPLRRTLRVAGIIEDDNSRHRVIAARFEGRIERLHVNFEGAEVPAGAPLAEITSVSLNTRLGEYRLLAAGPGRDPAALRAAATRLRQLGLTEEQMRAFAAQPEQPWTIPILAPVGGTVVKQSVYEGAYVKEGDPLFEIADFSAMWFTFDVYEQDLAGIHAGQHVRVRTPSVPGRDLSATVNFINPNLAEGTRTAKVRAILPNPLVGEGAARRRELLHRLTAEAEVELDPVDALSIPRSAVLWPGGAARVFVERGPGAYERRAIRLGRAGDDRWEVFGGLAAGEKVVVQGGVLLDGQAQLAGHDDPAAPPGAMPVAPPAPPEGAGEFLRALAAVSEALAADDLPSYRAAAVNLPAPPTGLDLPRLDPGAADLRAARASFLPLSVAASRWALPFVAGLPALRVMRCPMTHDIAPGAPGAAEWVQAGTGVRNPYFGDAMLNCGGEVRP